MNPIEVGLDLGDAAPGRQWLYVGHDAAGTCRVSNTDEDVDQVGPEEPGPLLDLRLREPVPVESGLG